MKNLALLDEMQLNLAKERVLVLDDVVDNNSMFYLEYQLNKLKKIDKDLDVKKPEPIEILINSPGGSVLDCLGLINLIYSMKEEGYVIKTHIRGYAASCASVIAVCGSKGYRTMGRFSRHLVHQVSGGVVGELQLMQNELEFTEELWKDLKKIYMENSNFKNEDLEEIKKYKLDLWLNSQKCLELGLADKIV